jgi:xanthine dehydrogenase accessory factor
MRDIISDITDWPSDIAVATVVSTWGSAPRQVGAKLAMTPDHKLAGSVSGGCIEGAVFEEAMDVLSSGRARLLNYGVADETAFEVVGLACGGSIEVFVEPLTEQMRTFWMRAVREERACATVTVIRGPGDLVGYKLLIDDAGIASANRSDERYNAITAQLLTLGTLALNGRSSKRAALPDLDADVFIDVQMPSPQLVLVGAVHIAQALLPIAQAVGFRVTVIDPRPAFGNALRFPAAERLIADYPPRAFAQLTISRSTAIVVLTHDSKFDDPALIVALQSDAFYVGALGGKKTREQRRARLLKAGLRDAHLDQLHAPIGLDLGARTPEEIALATMAQIIAVRNSAGSRPHAA